MKQKYITLLPIALLALSASYGIYSFSLLFVPWYIAGITALAFELTYCTLVFIDSSKAKPVSVMAVVVSTLWNVGHSMFVLYPASVDMVFESIWLSFLLSVIHGVPLATLAYLVADVSLHSSASGNSANSASANSARGASVSSVNRNTQIVEERKKGVTYRELSERYNLSVQRIRQIVRGG